MATGFGLRLVGRVGGGAARIREYFVPSTDSTALFEGDVVKLPDTTGAMDADGRKTVITRAVAGDATKVGVVVGFRPDGTLPLTGQYRAASTARYVQVCDDPNAIYEVQEDAVGGSVTAALIGAMSNADIIVASGSTTTGFSGTMLDSNTAGASAADLKILGVSQTITTPANVAALSGGAVLLVRILSAESSLIATDSQL